MTTKPHIEAASAVATAALDAFTFKDLGVSENVLSVLTKHGFVTPTPIQSRVVKTGIEGKDIIGIAETGTGKTLGFGIPMIERILKNKASRGLVVVPTRELALQVDETLRKIGSTLGIYTAVLIGGDSMYRQVREIRNGPNIVIATPGRLIDHLKQGNIKLDSVATLVLDEADHMFDIGFAPQVREIMKRVPKERQTLLFSATMPEEISKLAMEHMQLPLRIEVSPQGTAARNVEQEIIVIDRKAKFNLLVKLLAEVKGEPVLVFARTKYGVKNMVQDLIRTGITAAEIHSNRSLGQRKEALEGFKKHKYQVLAATDIAARGIDVKDISLVVNYDLPEKSEDYVHRIGRTGRAGKSGRAISFATPDQGYDIAAIERLMKKEIPKKSHEGATISRGAHSPRPSYRGGGYKGSRPAYGGSRGGFGAPRSGGAGGYRGGSSFSGPRSTTGGSGFGSERRFAPAGAFKVHTNQPFKGGAPRSADSASRSAGGPARAYGASSRPFNSAPRRGGFNSKFPRPLKTDPSKSSGIGTGYKRVFRKGVR